MDLRPGRAGARRLSYLRESRSLSRATVEPRGVAPLYPHCKCRMPPLSGPISIFVSFVVASGRARRNRTFSRSFGGSLVTMTLHPMSPLDRFEQQRLVPESNRSHPIDSGTATPVASRGRFGATACAARIGATSAPRELECPRQESNLRDAGLGDQCLSARPRGLSKQEIGVTYGNCTRLHWVTASPRH